jgi:hypothetical protein
MASRTKDLRFRTTLYNWPAAEEDVVKFITGNEAAGHEVYFSPDLFKPEAMELKRTTKDLVLGSRVICLDFDGNAPDSSVWDETGTYEGLPEPSLIVQSSEVENQHMYWVMDEFITDIPYLENMRRAITYKLKADGSGWDAGQLLRPPFTTNHGYVKKRTQTYDVFVERDSDRVYPAIQFTPPKDFRALVSEAIDTDGLPSLNKVLSSHDFFPGFIELFDKTLEDLTSSRDRSGALSQVGHFAAESGLSDPEIYVLVQDADTRWGKYVGRTDRHKQLSNLVARSREKHPFGADKIGLGPGFTGDGEAEVATPTVFSFKEMRVAPFDLNWFITDLLTSTGYGLFVGDPGVGKTQILIRLGMAVALGGSFMDLAINPDLGPRRVMMFALEMNAVGVKKFLNDMTDVDEATEDRLHDNFFIYPQDREIHLDDDKSHHVFEQYLQEYKPSLVIIDSLSKAVRGSLNKDEDVRKVNTYLDYVRRRFGCAIIAVHHSKKRQANDHRAYDSDMDWVYGSRFITTDADFVLAFTHTGERGKIMVHYSKVRYGPILEPFFIQRTKELNFEMTVPPADNRDALKGAVNLSLYEDMAKGINVSKPDTTGTSGPDTPEGDAKSF